MKKTICMMMVLVTLMMSLVAHGEVTPADLEALRTHKVFQTEGELKGTWTIGFERNEENLYPCVLDLGDGRKILVPLTDEEVNALMYKALEEQHQRTAEEAKKAESDNPGFLARVGDWITFWN